MDFNNITAVIQRVQEHLRKYSARRDLVSALGLAIDRIVVLRSSGERTREELYTLAEQYLRLKEKYCRDLAKLYFGLARTEQVSLGELNFILSAPPQVLTPPREASLKLEFLKKNPLVEGGGAAAFLKEVERQQRELLWIERRAYRDFEIVQSGLGQYLKKCKL